MAWLSRYWPWAAFNTVAVLVLGIVVYQCFWDIQSLDPYGFGSVLNLISYSGKWAVRFLLISLAMTPLYTLTGWPDFLTLRKPAGLWAFTFALSHLGALVASNFRGVTLAEFIQADYVLFGFAAFAILLIMALTSHRWAMRWLGKSWKRLHRLVYMAGALVLLHLFTVIDSSKKISLSPINTATEFRIYLVIFALLMFLRLPPISKFIRDKRGKVKRKRKPIYAETLPA